MTVDDDPVRRDSSGETYVVISRHRQVCGTRSWCQYNWLKKVTVAPFVYR